MKIAIILGTRPEIIKMSPIIKECKRKRLNLFVLHTGQHYSYKLNKIFFNELELPLPEYNLEIGSGTHAEQTGRVMIGVEKILMKEVPDILLVQGDTNTTLGGALAAVKLGIKVGHVEAGLRSYDRKMPEEINRILTDHISDFLFTPTKEARRNLINEGNEEDKIFITGNTIVDAIYQNLEIATRKSNILQSLGLKPKEYFVVTIHRQENVNVKERLKEILKGLELIHKEFSMPVLFPMHPRTQKRIKEFGLSLDNITTIKPLGFLDFLQLEANAKLVLTDSGGIQEETCILKVPCVTLRENTERPETLEMGSNVLAGTKPSNILNAVKKMLHTNKSWDNPFGDGKAGKRIIKLLQSLTFS